MSGDRVQQDAMIGIESTAEWQVHDILYDGQERYVAPLTFTDHVAKYARKIDWRKLMGAETSADTYDSDEEQDNVEDVQKQRPVPVDGEESSGSYRYKTREQETGREGLQGGMGPWDSVAKRLLQSLTEMNVLLDVIQVARNGKYLTLDAVQQETLEQPKNAVLAAKKRALGSCNGVLTTLADQIRPKTAAGVTLASQQQLDPELEELMDMRKHWRLKKVGNAILGDLSHFTTSGYRPNATFEAKKVEKGTSTVGSSDDSRGTIDKKYQAWEVVLPKDLEEALLLQVALEAPDETVCHSMDYVGERNAVRTNEDKSDWRNRLRMAQRTLFCRDLFAQLAREAAHVPELCCAITGRTITVRLECGHSVRISLQPYPPDDQICGSSSKDDGMLWLEHNIHQLFDAELAGAREVMIPRPIGAPLTHLSKKARLAGPDALPVNALSCMDSTDKLLIQRFLDQASHWLLYKRCKEEVEEFAGSCQDPVISVRWCPETTGVWSMVIVHMMTPYYEFCGKTAVMIEIGVNEVRTTMRDAEVVVMKANMEELGQFLRLKARQHIISAVGTLCRPHQWQTLYSNPCHSSDGVGELSPAILVGHPAGTSAIFVKYPLMGEPIVAIQSTSTGFHTKETADQGQLWLYLRDQLHPCAYDRLQGFSILHKIELLIATLI